MPVVDESVNPGTLRHLVTVQQKTVTGHSASGEDVYLWVDYATMRAQIRQLAGRELAALQQVWSDARYQVTIQYCPGLTTDMRIVWGDRYLDMLDIQDPPGTRRYLVIIAKEVK